MLKLKLVREVYPALMKVIKMIKQDIGNKVIIVRADNAKGEFGSKFQNKCKEDGI